MTGSGQLNIVPSCIRARYRCALCIKILIATTNIKYIENRCLKVIVSIGIPLRIRTYSIYMVEENSVLKGRVSLSVAVQNDSRGLERYEQSNLFDRFLARPVESMGNVKESLTA